MDRIGDSPLKLSPVNGGRATARRLHRRLPGRAPANWILLACSILVHGAIVAGLPGLSKPSQHLQRTIVLELADILPTPNETPALPIPKIALNPDIASTPKPQSVIPVESRTPAIQPKPEAVLIKPAEDPVSQLGAIPTESGLVRVQETESAAREIPVAQPKPIGEPQQLPQQPQPKPRPEPPPIPAADIKALLTDYAAGIKQAVLANRVYPASAERLGHQGQVKVGFTISADGSLLGVQVKSSSGFSELDEAARGAVSNAAPFSAMPTEVGRESLVLSLTLRFYLQ